MNSGCFPDSHLSNRTISLQNIHCAFFRQINRKGSFEYKDIRQLAKQQPGSGAKLLGTPAGSKPRSQHQAAQLHLLAWSGLGHFTARKHHLLRNNNAEGGKIQLFKRREESIGENICFVILPPLENPSASLPKSMASKRLCNSTTPHRAGSIRSRRLGGKDVEILYFAFSNRDFSSHTRSLTNSYKNWEVHSVSLCPFRVSQQYQK